MNILAFIAFVWIGHRWRAQFFNKQHLEINSIKSTKACSENVPSLGSSWEQNVSRYRKSRITCFVYKRPRSYSCFELDLLLWNSISALVSSQKKSWGGKKILMENNSKGNQVLEDQRSLLLITTRRNKTLPWAESYQRHVEKSRARSSLVDCKPQCW